MVILNRKEVEKHCKWYLSGYTPLELYKSAIQDFCEKNGILLPNDFKWNRTEKTIRIKGI